MRARPIVVALCAAATVFCAAWWMRRGDEPAAGGSSSGAVPAAQAPAAGSDERPPEFPAVRGDEDRIAHWVHTVANGADDDVAWASSRLERAGARGRSAFRDAARVAIESNVALTEQALDFLLKSPEDSDGEFAVAALLSRDSQAVVRAMRLLGAVRGGAGNDVAKAIGAAGSAGPRDLRLESIAALAKRNDPDAAAEALKLVDGATTVDAPDAVRALEAFRLPAVRDAVASIWSSDAALAIRFAAADVMVGWNEPRPVPWLESLVASPPAGAFDFADAALGVLAKARHEGALARIGATAADALAGTSARVIAVRRLAPYRLEAKLEFLTSAAAPSAGADPEVVVEAMDALVRAGAPGGMERLEHLVREGDATSGTAAALVLGRVRRREAAPALVDAIRRKDQSDEMRALYLRALVLSGAPETAGVVVRAIAEDRVPYDAPLSLAYNAGAMLGETGPEFRAALGAELVRVLRGDLGPLAGAGLVQSLRAAGICCGPEASSAIASYLVHADAEVRLSAALALGYTAGPDAERDLRAAWFRCRDEPSRSAIAKAMERVHYRSDEAGRSPR
jgi:hypothetical protein